LKFTYDTKRRNLNDEIYKILFIKRSQLYAPLETENPTCMRCKITEQERKFMKRDNFAKFGRNKGWMLHAGNQTEFGSTYPDPTDIDDPLYLADYERSLDLEILMEEADISDDDDEYYIALAKTKHK
jgi:hypothetical protein